MHAAVWLNVSYTVKEQLHEPPGGGPHVLLTRQDFRCAFPGINHLWTNLQNLLQYTVKRHCLGLHDALTRILVAAVM